MLHRARRVWLPGFVALWAVTIAASAPAAEEPPWGAAWKLELRGRYAEAEEAWQALLEIAPARAALGVAACRRAVGNRSGAIASLKTVWEQQPTAAVATSRAQLSLDQGNLAEARQWVDAAQRLAVDDVTARWLAAEIDRCTGRVEQAAEGYALVAAAGTEENIEDPWTAYHVGLATAQQARWLHQPEMFRRLVGEFYAAVLAREPSFWPAHVARAGLFLEKFNSADAQREIAAALRINPFAAEIHVAAARLALQSYQLDAARRAAERARELNREYLPAWQTLADIASANFELDLAARFLAGAQELNPHDEETLGRLAAWQVAAMGWSDDPTTAFGAIQTRVLSANPAAGAFYLVLGQRLEERRKFADAERALRAAQDRLPQLVEPAACLGLLLMRQGREDEARPLLEAARNADPFHVRVANMLAVLEVLASYETLTTEHFHVRFSPQHDRLLARHMAAHLESTFPALCRWLGYEPPGQTLIEVFNRSQATDAHGWFSARMVGLPYVGTVGACAGGMVALASPSAMAKPYNWARVVDHELVHVVNLQQTNFNIPHWFTEGLATFREGFPRSEKWNRLLVKGWNGGQLFDLTTINSGFIRPHSSDDWQLAYCQAELYVEYFQDQFGADAMARLLAAFAQQPSTAEALQLAFGQSCESIDAGYRDYLGRIVAALSLAGSLPGPRALAILERTVAERPDDAASWAELAQWHFERRQVAAAGRAADRALELDPGQPTALVVAARLQSGAGHPERATALLTPALDSPSPDPRVVTLFATLELAAGRSQVAERWFRWGADRYPDQVEWWQRLAALYLRAENESALTEVLLRWAGIDAENGLIRLKLAQLAARRDDWPAAIDWARAAMHVNVADNEALRLLARALGQVGEHGQAAAEWEALVSSEPAPGNDVLHWATACAAAGDRVAARQIVERALAARPIWPEAQALAKELAP